MHNLQQSASCHKLELRQPIGRVHVLQQPSCNRRQFMPFTTLAQRRCKITHGTCLHASSTSVNADGYEELKRRPYHPALTLLPLEFWPSNPNFDRNSEPPPPIPDNYDPLAFHPYEDDSTTGFTADEAAARRFSFQTETGEGDVMTVPSSSAGTASLRAEGGGVYDVLLEKNYSRSLPRIYFQDGSIKFDLGMFSPKNANKYLQVEGQLYIPSNNLVRGLQLVYGALYFAAHAVVFAVLYQFDPYLSLALSFNWVRKTLTPLKIVLLFGLSAVNRSWVYWVFAAGCLVDAWLAKALPPVRNFMVHAFVLWCVYLALAPIQCYPLPFGPFATEGFAIEDVIRRWWLLR